MAFVWAAFYDEEEIYELQKKYRIRGNVESGIVWDYLSRATK